MAARANTTCAWQTIVTNGQTTTSEDCTGTGITKSADESVCPAPKPSDGLNSHSICCCGQYTAPAASTPPKFDIPQLQITIPTLNLSAVTCTSNNDGTYHCDIPWVAEYIKAIYNYGLDIAGILAAIMLMAGGVLWLISAGDASKVTQAKELITGSIIGLLILVSSYIILTQINPSLMQFYPIGIGTIKKLEFQLAETRNNSTANQYKNAACPSDAELASGVNFYATGYYKPAWEDSDTFRCIVAMQCSCPSGRDLTKNCDQLYGTTDPGYHPCNSFPSTTPYCNKAANGQAPQLGNIAGPSNCNGNLPLGTQVCFKSKTYTITDAGGSIQGRRLDIWNGDSLANALQSTGIGSLTKGACK
jgi:hypothetical protein